MQAERIPPQNLDAERSVLGCVMLSAHAMDDLEDSLGADDFYAPANAEIFRAASALHEAGSPVDAVTVSHELGGEKLEQVGGAEYLGRILETVPHAAHVAYYAELIVAASRRRKLIDACQDGIRESLAGQDVSEVVSRAEGRLHAILEATAGTKKSVSISDLLEEVIANLDSAAPPGLSLGWSDLDKIYQPQPGHLVIVAGRPSMGKSALASGAALNIGRHGKRTLFFSLEQTKLELTERLLASWSGVSGSKISRMEYLEDGDRELILKASSGLAGIPVDIDDDADTTVSRIAAKSRVWKRRHGLDLLVVDYLQLIEPEETRSSREQQVAVMSRRLKKLAGSLEVPVMCLAQLNRQPENRPDKRPRLSDLRESGSIEQDANCVIFIHRPEVYNANDKPGEAELIVAKNRNGKTGTVNLQFDNPTVTFRNLAKGLDYYGRQDF